MTFDQTVNESYDSTDADTSNILLPRSFWAAMHTATKAAVLVGWTPESPGRGTFSIITSCFFTILICTWTVIHPRIHTSIRIARLHKLCQLVKTIMAPEMVCLESLQEWVQARKMVRRTAAATDNGLKMLHAFYIGMLGIRYRTENGYRVLWPSQYAWLLNNHLVRWADRDAWGLSMEVIRDKSKADGLVKLAALFQVSWFTLQCITRAAHNLPIAPMEAMTLAYVFVVILTYAFWWIKPKDIATASYVDLPPMTSEQWDVFESLAMENTYDNDDPSAKPSKNIAWYLVGRDCKDDEVLVMGQVVDVTKKRDVEVAVKAVDEEEHPQTDTTTAIDKKRRVPVTWGPGNKHTKRFDNEFKVAATWSPRRYNTDNAVDGRTNRSMVHRSTNNNEEGRHTSTSEAPKESKVITEWDEALYMSRFWPLICILGSAFGAFHLISWNSAFPTIAERWLWRSSALTSVATSILCMHFRTISLEWDGPLSIMRVGSPLFYGISRLVMMAEVFASLRAMAPATYDTYEIWNYWLHFL